MRKVWFSFLRNNTPIDSFSRFVKNIIPKVISSRVLMFFSLQNTNVYEMVTVRNPHMKSVKCVLLTWSATKVNILAKVNIMRRFHASIPSKPLALPWLHNKGEGALWIWNDLNIFDGDSSLYSLVPQIQHKPLDILGRVGRNSLLLLQNPEEVRGHLCSCFNSS